MSIEIDLQKGTEDLEVQLGYLCNHLERGNKAVDTEIEELLNFAHRGLIFGTTEENQNKIKNLCYRCKTLMETQNQLISVIEPTLTQLNFLLKRSTKE